MPRVADIYSRPAGIDAVPNATIESVDYNANVADVEADLNLPRPLVAGGTGANSAATARTNLQAERVSQQVTNYDTHVFEGGSFWSAVGATGAPVGASGFIGIAYLYANDPTNWAFVEARNMNDSVNPGRVYVRQRVNGVWGAWTLEAANDKVAKAGDTMTGNLVISKNSPALILKETSTGGGQLIGCDNSNRFRWSINLASAAAMDFGITRYDDAGAQIDNPISVSRSTGVTSFNNTTPSTSATTGSVYFAGGVGFQSAINVGTTIQCLGNLAVNASLGSVPGVSNTITGLSVLASNGAAFLISRGTATSASFNVNVDGTNIELHRSGTLVGSITVTTTATAYNTSSDGRLKEDLKSFDAGHIIDDTMVYDFAWKTTGERAYGVIAQQAKEVYETPTFYDEKEDRWFIDYSKYVPVILQELKALRARVAELEGKLAPDVPPA